MRRIPITPIWMAMAFLLFLAFFQGRWDWGWHGQGLFIACGLLVADVFGEKL